MDVGIGLEESCAAGPLTGMLRHTTALIRWLIVNLRFVRSNTEKSGSRRTTFIALNGYRGKQHAAYE